MICQFFNYFCTVLTVLWFLALFLVFYLYIDVDSLPDDDDDGNDDDKDDSKTEKALSSDSLHQDEKRPRIRPNETVGITRRMRTGEGTLYITINHDKNGLCEVFTTIGKAGGNAAAQSEAISRLISLALRSGLDPHSIVRQLKGISGPNPTWEDGRLVLSTPDAIGKALDDYLKESNNGTVDPSLAGDKVRITMAPQETAFECAEGQSRNECQNVVNEGGCLTCRECGWSKCD